MTNTLLLIDGNRSHAGALREALLSTKAERFRIRWVRTLSKGLERASKPGIRAIFLNAILCDCQGIETLDRLRLMAPGVPILVLGGATDERLATEALQHGAQDYLPEDQLDQYAFARAVHKMTGHAAGEELTVIYENVTQARPNSFEDSLTRTDIPRCAVHASPIAKKMTG